MLRIWGRTNSINVQKVLLCADALGLAYERIDAGMAFGLVNTPEFRARNPNGLVPVIDDDGFTLWESNVIVRYLCARSGDETYYPADIRKRADLERWMDWQQTTLGGPVNALFWGLVRKPGSRTPEELEKARAAADLAMRVVERKLDETTGEGSYISGSRIGMADFALAPLIHRWINLPAQHPDLPAIKRYYELLMARPKSKRILALPLT